MEGDTETSQTQCPSRARFLAKHAKYRGVAQLPKSFANIGADACVSFVSILAGTAMMENLRYFAAWAIVSMLSQFERPIRPYRS